MKTVPTALATLIFSGQYVSFDLYTITLFNGVVIRFTTADFPIAFNGAVWATTPLVDQKDSKTQGHWKVGLDTDTWLVVVMPRPFDPVTGAAFPDTIGNLPWIQAAQGGALDAADFQVDEAVFASVPTWPIAPGGAVPSGIIPGKFAGVVAEVDTTDSVAVITANDYRSLLAQQMPLHFYQASCRWRLFDAGCTLVASSFVKTGSVNAGSSNGTIVMNGGTTPAAGLTFTLGTVVMTSGNNATFSRTISSWDGNDTLILFNPFPFDIEPGDTFQIYPGCNLSLGSCQAFGNEINFGGQPFIPPPETAA